MKKTTKTIITVAIALICCILCAINASATSPDADATTQESTHAHEMTEWVVTKAPTCEKDGWEERHCTSCPEGRMYCEVRSLKATGHDLLAEEIAPTCEEKGYTAYTCMTCGKVCTGNTVPALGHNYEVVEKQPSCTKDGFVGYACTKCGEESEGEKIHATGHKWTSWTEYIAPSCTSNGWEKRICDVCGVKESRKSQPTGHRLISTVKEATCEEDGYTENQCSECGFSYKSHHVRAQGHTFGEWDMKHTANGKSAIRSCSNCDATETKTLILPAKRIPLLRKNKGIIAITWKESFSSVCFSAGRMW